MKRKEKKNKLTNYSHDTFRFPLTDTFISTFAFLLWIKNNPPTQSVERGV